MTVREREDFIEQMRSIGDEWTDKQVRDVYGDWTLQDALDDRRGQLVWLANIIVNVVTGPSKSDD